MNQLRIASGVFALGALVWVAGAIAPWSSIGDEDYAGLRGDEPVWATLVALVLVALTSGLVGRRAASVGRWTLLPVAALIVLLTFAFAIDVATSTAADVAQGVGEVELTREVAWGLWVSLGGAVVALVAGVVAVLAPSPGPGRRTS